MIIVCVCVAIKIVTQRPSLSKNKNIIKVKANLGLLSLPKTWRRAKGLSGSNKQPLLEVSDKLGRVREYARGHCNEMSLCD